MRSAWGKKNPEKIRKNYVEWSKLNPEKAKYFSEKWSKENPIEAAAKKLKWAKLNPGKKNAVTARRRATKKNATPKWLTKSQNKEIQNLYITAKELQWLTTDKNEVDHIIPLIGVNENGEHVVSGLHVLWNLQILSSKLNKEKGNKFDFIKYKEEYLG